MVVIDLKFVLSLGSNRPKGGGQHQYELHLVLSIDRDAVLSTIPNRSTLILRLTFRRDDDDVGAVKCFTHL